MESRWQTLRANEEKPSLSWALQHRGGRRDKNTGGTPMLGLSGGNGRGISANAKCGRRAFPVCPVRGGRGEAGRFAYSMLLLGQLFTGTDHHENHSSQQKGEHTEHENNAPGKARANPTHPGFTGHARWFLAPFTSHQRRQITHRQRTKQGKKPEHLLSLIYLSPRCKRLPEFCRN